MSKIRIKNFGPIKEGYQDNDGWIDIKKVTVFIGNQGSGKSTVAKLISSFTWMEKALVRGDYTIKQLERKNKFSSQFLKYHRLENYHETKDTVIEYIGDAYSIRYSEKTLTATENKKGSYHLPQIMYVPAERNFIAYVKNPKELKLSSASLQEFLNEFVNAQNDLKKLLKLPINNVRIEYDRLNDTLNLRGEDYRLKLTDSSSGFQSLVPLYIVSRYLSDMVKDQSENKAYTMSSEEQERFRKDFKAIWGNKDLTDEQRRIALSEVSAKFKKTAFINIVEEPEQNLFPSSQKQMLYGLLKYNNANEGNKLIITTHSPYLINILSIAIQAGVAKGKASTKSESIINRIGNIIPLESIIHAKDVAIYQLDESLGSISKLGDYDGIPSDKNFLNQFLAEGNRLFDALLEIEEEL